MKGIAARVFLKYDVCTNISAAAIKDGCFSFFFIMLLGLGFEWSQGKTKLNKFLQLTRLELKSPV